MNSKIPPYLYEKGNIVRLILFTALFALLFINIFQPFGSRGWYPEISDTKYFVFSSLIILTGMLVVVVSRMIMYYYALRLSISYVQFALWILCEILAMSLFFSLFTKFIPSQGAERQFSEIFRSCTINTGLILLLPYSISWLYFSWKEKYLCVWHYRHPSSYEILPAVLWEHSGTAAGNGSGWLWDLCCISEWILWFGTKYKN